MVAAPSHLAPTCHCSSDAQGSAHIGLEWILSAAVEQYGHQMPPISWFASLWQHREWHTGSPALLARDADKAPDWRTSQVVMACQGQTTGGFRTPQQVPNQSWQIANKETSTRKVAGSKIAVLIKSCWFALFGLVSVELPLLLFSTQGLPWITGAEVPSLLGLCVCVWGHISLRIPNEMWLAEKDPYLYAYTLAFQSLLQCKSPFVKPGALSLQDSSKYKSCIGAYWGNTCIHHHSPTICQQFHLYPAPCGCKQSCRSCKASDVGQLLALPFGKSKRCAPSLPHSLTYCSLWTSAWNNKPSNPSCQRMLWYGRVCLSWNRMIPFLLAIIPHDYHLRVSQNQIELRKVCPYPLSLSIWM